MSQERSIEQQIADSAKEYFDALQAGYICTLNWHDAEKHDFLIVTKKEKAVDVYAAEAKGQTPYELIQIYGGVDGVQAAFPGDGTQGYGDFTQNPEIINEESLQKLANDLNGYIEQAKQAKAIFEKAKADLEAEKQKQEAGNAGVTGEGVKE